jgi:hypothetical protein
MGRDQGRAAVVVAPLRSISATAMSYSEEIRAELPAPAVVAEVAEEIRAELTIQAGSH